MYSQQRQSHRGQQQNQGQAQNQQPQQQPPLYYYPQGSQHHSQQYDYSQYQHQYQHQQYQQYQQQQQQQQYHGYQQYQQYQNQAQQQTPLQSQLAAALAPISGLLNGNSMTGPAASPLPPSYNTPLPPAKSRGNKPFGQIQAHYHSNMQLGAAAASAASAALLGHSYSGNSSNANNANSTASGTSQASGVQDGTSESVNGEWYSSYQTPTVQQRLAVTMAASNQPPGGARSAHPPRPNRNMNNNRQQGNQGRHNNNHNNQKGKKPTNNSSTSSSQVAAAEPSKQVEGFHCDACDVTFHEEAKLKIHISAHRTCSDCQYSASPSLVSEHRRLTHGPKAVSTEGTEDSTNTPISSSSSSSLSSTKRNALAAASKARSDTRQHPQKSKKPFIQEPGLPKLPALDTPEDIANWIAQRRRAWPTESNIQKKELERQEMIAKGQIVEKVSPNDAKGRDKRKRDNHQKESGQSMEVDSEQKDVKKTKTTGDGPTVEGVVAYSSSTEYTTEDDDEEMDPVKDAVTSKDPSVMGKVSLPADRQLPKRPCRYFMRGRCGKGDNCTYSHDPSLKLLSNEVKQEKNVILEALRYIVDNNFFDRQEPTGALVEVVTN
ncbi:nuclear fragile X mental retardation protein interacting protein 1 [Podila epigama]|nr:nuclear fragile X mental retardation protein interacting protein 1 [Podila epigama]